MPNQLQVGNTLINSIESDSYYIYMSSFDPWFDRSISGSWSVINSPSRVYDLNNPDMEIRIKNQNKIKDQLIGIKRLHSSNVKLVTKRNDDVIGATGQIVPEDSVLTDLNRFIVSESKTKSGEFYVYDIIQGPTASGLTFHTSPNSLSEVLNESNFNLTYPYGMSDTLNEAQIKLLYKIKGFDAKFVTDSYIPVMNSGDFSSIQERVRLTSSNGEIIGIDIQNGGTGYQDGAVVTLSNETGTGFKGIARVTAGVIVRIEVTSKGVGYRPNTTNPHNNYVPDLVTVPGGSGLLAVPIYSDYNGLGFNPIRLINPSDLMFYNTFATNAVEYGSPFIDGMHGFTIGLIKSPVKNNTSSVLLDELATGYTKLSLINVGSPFNIVLPPLNYDLEGTRVDIRITTYQTTPDFTVNRIHTGKLLKYELIDNSVNLYFVDKDTSGIGWDLTGIGTGSATKYAVEFVVYSDVSDGAIDVVTSSFFTTVNLAVPPEVQDIEVFSGEVIYAARVPVPTSTMNIEKAWTMNDHIIREFRLIAPII